MEIDPAGLVIWLDESLLVVNKPAGLPTLVDGYHPQAPYLVGILKARYTPLWVVHRLDRETSGVITFARTAEAHRSLNTQFETHQASKRYHAIAVGDPPWETHEIRLPLRPNGDRRHRTVVDLQHGKPAETRLRVIERFGDFCLIEAAPLTGRTHQIRAHLAAAGFPLAGDVLYRPQSPRAPVLNQPIDRVGLHAAILEITHPSSNQPSHFEAPYPADFTQALAELRRPVAPPAC